jgi:hypothetical protein
VTETATEEPSYDPEADGEGLTPFERRLRRKKGLEDAPRKPALPTPIGFRPGMLRRPLGTAHVPLPKGRELESKKRRVKDLGTVHDAVLPADLGPGRYLLTVIVWDPAKPKGEARPWVLKDDRGLLEDRFEWTLEVRAAPSEPK